MHVDTDETKMVGNTVNDAALPAFPVSQACELTICVVEGIGANLKRHADNVDAQVAIIVKVSRDNSEEASEKSHICRCHLEPLEKLSQTKPYWAEKIEIEKSLDLACLISGFDARTRWLSSFHDQKSSAIENALRRPGAPPEGACPRGC